MKREGGTHGVRGEGRGQVELAWGPTRDSAHLGTRTGPVILGMLSNFYSPTSGF